MDWECRKCEAENVTAEYSFGDDVTCAVCGAVHETDWDYTDEDSWASWVVGLRPTPPDGQQPGGVVAQGGEG